MKSKMIRKTLEIIGWIAAGTVGLGVAIYLVAIAINWRDQAPSAATVQLAKAYRDRQILSHSFTGCRHRTSGSWRSSK
jgi:hypothetical protein